MEPEVGRMAAHLPGMIHKEPGFRRLLEIVHDLNPRAFWETGVFQGGPARFALAAATWALLWASTWRPRPCPTVPVTCCSPSASRPRRVQPRNAQGH
ncbi:protein of unknown function [Candidatus Hydrogenisulfobacillus filiaventi]|uniref:Uncharacterized protein n=1 Tax=Candidatus Hydrogenisulfobacillus filiaventi TaxID=2707344 RepID=A0A6F8ZED7_9FIRM|nr:protein of unknown function [Candidatus Hydrogenisulfobacillus filiaventi]